MTMTQETTNNEVLVPGDIFRLEHRDSNEDLTTGLKFRNWRSYELIQWIEQGETLTYLGQIICPELEVPLYTFYASQNAKFYLTQEHFNSTRMVNSDANASPWWYLRKLT